MFLHSGAIMHQHMHAHRNSSKITKQIKYQVRLYHKSSISHISSPQVQTATYYKHHVWAQIMYFRWYSLALHII